MLLLNLKMNNGNSPSSRTLSSLRINQEISAVIFVNIQGVTPFDAAEVEADFAEEFKHKLEVCSWKTE
jgi:hypothetical protein